MPETFPDVDADRHPMTTDRPDDPDWRLDTPIPFRPVEERCSEIDDPRSVVP